MDDNPDGEPLPQYRHRYWVEEDRTPLPTLYDEDGFPVIDFARPRETLSCPPPPTPT